MALAFSERSVIKVASRPNLDPQLLKKVTVITKLSSLYPNEKALEKIDLIAFLKRDDMTKEDLIIVDEIRNAVRKNRLYSYLLGSDDNTDPTGQDEKQ